MQEVKDSMLFNSLNNNTKIKTYSCQKHGETHYRALLVNGEQVGKPYCPNCLKEKEKKPISAFQKPVNLNPDSKTLSFFCKKHGKVNYLALFIDGRQIKETQCPNCREEELKQIQQKEQEEATRRQAILRKERIENNLSKSMIPPRFKNKNFAAFETDQNSRKEKILNICKNYAQNFASIRQKGTSLILTGNTGTGKTHLACSIAEYIMENHNLTALFLRASQATRTVKETYSKHSDQTEKAAIESFLMPDLLILDEIGVQFGTDTEKLIIFEIINGRYENLKPTILLSNLAVENLKQYLGERILDRMKEDSGKLLIFDWESNRK